MNTCPFCDIQHTVAVPAVHLNGTAADDLREQLRAASDAMGEAIVAVQNAAPNSRDYYVQPEGIGQYVAAKEHENRMLQLTGIRAQLLQMLDHVQTVIDYKEEGKRSRAR